MVLVEEKKKKRKEGDKNREKILSDMAIAAIPDDESSSQMAEEYLQSKGLVLLLPYFLIAFPKMQHCVC